VEKYCRIRQTTIRFVIPVVFNKLIRVECMFLSNTTLFYLMVEVVNVNTPLTSNKIKLC